MRSRPTLLSGTDALVRLPLLQRARDRAAGLNTAGFISGYRGSPLGGYDQKLWRTRELLTESNILFQPAVNEDLAATAIWGTQQVGLLPGAKYQGIFALWYGKGPGVDRSGDAIKHGNRAGTAPHGGVLVVFGDDHPGKSSTLAHQSEQALAASEIPVLYPATVAECLVFGLYGWELSRFAGVWTGVKYVNETAETTSSVDLDGLTVAPVLPESDQRRGDVHARHAFDPGGDEARLVLHKLPMAQEFVRANPLDRAVLRGPDPLLGIISAGKTWLDVREALKILEMDDERCLKLGVSLYKPALIWPLEPQRLREFARGHRELLVVEEKRAFIEAQAAHVLFNLGEARPRLSGKAEPDGRPLLPAQGQIDPLVIARAVGRRLLGLGVSDEGLRARVEAIEHRLDAARPPQSPLTRSPYFCSGCPHNTSTRIPADSWALAGIGCHAMAMAMKRNTLPPTHMGGEGVTWTGMAPFTDLPHVFQNLGDGTYYHSGLLAIRAAVLSEANITYKILLNDAVAMTGGQPVEGGFSAVEIARQLIAERVRRVAVLAEEPESYCRGDPLPPGVSLHSRDDLEAVQEEFRRLPGTTAIIYDQICAAEKRRRRRRGKYPAPARRAFINTAVCEGCGDCSVQSNCLSIEPVSTPFGHKRRIEQSSCNVDLTCVKGFCPSFVLVKTAKLRRGTIGSLATHTSSLLDNLSDVPEPERTPVGETYNVLVAGIGGTGVVTVASVLASAAQSEGYRASVFDMTGLAQKGGAVVSHLRISGPEEGEYAPRIGSGQADVVLGADLVVAAAADVRDLMDSSRTQLVVNSHMAPTAEFQGRPELVEAAPALLALLAAAVDQERITAIDGTRMAETLLGDRIGANFLLVGVALQRGLLRMSPQSVEAAIRGNGVSVGLNVLAFRLGRLAGHAPEQFYAYVASSSGSLDEGGPDTSRKPAGARLSLADVIDRRAEFLEKYQNAGYAERYRSLVERTRAAEECAASGLSSLSGAVAECYFKLLAYKDEYEVARLYTDGSFRRQLADQFRSFGRVSLLLSPPLLARRDRHTGQPRKMEFGPWIFPVLGVLARLRFLRQTPLDPFGWTRERRTERGLITEYEQLIGRLLEALAPHNHALAVALAGLPRELRGFGHVKQRRLEEIKRREAALWSCWEAAGARRESA